MKKHTGWEWIEFFDIEMIDPDGWRIGEGVTLDTPITLEGFINRLNISTIQSPSRVMNRYIFNFLV